MTYIPLETAMFMLEKAYLASVIVLLAISYVGWVTIGKMEKTEQNLPLPKWFS